MHKVVVERPRWNPGPAKLNRRADLDLDLLSRCEGMRRPYRSRKAFTDLLGPLRRWLRAQVGRPWDDVYSEACAVIKPDSIVRAHIKTHLLEFVHRHTFLRDGRVWCFGRSRLFAPGIEGPVEEAASRWTPFYVHPANGRLCEVPLASQRERRRAWSELRSGFAPEQRWLGDTRALLRLNGLWFDGTMKAFPPYCNRGDEPVRQDVALKRRLNRSQAYDQYGRYVFCVAKRQLSSKELRRHGLTNHPADIAPRPAPESRSDGFPRGVTGPGFRRPTRRPNSPVNHNSTTEVPMQNHDQSDNDQPSFEITSKRRRGFPSETQVGRGHRVVHGDKELIEKLGRNDLCPCGSGRKFPRLLPAHRPLRRLTAEPLLSASDHRSRSGSLPDTVEQAASLLRCGSNRGLTARAT